MCKILILIFVIIVMIIAVSMFIYYKYDKFNSVLSIDECNNNHFDEEEKRKCINNVMQLKYNMNTQYQGQPANRGLTNPSGTHSGSFGNSAVIN